MKDSCTERSRLELDDDFVKLLQWANFHWSRCSCYPSASTLMLRLFASTKFCNFGIPTILRVLIFANSRSRAKFCDVAQTKGKSSTLKLTGLVIKVAVSRLKLLQCKCM